MKRVYPLAEAPIYEIFISEDDNTGIRMVSLVKDPAIDIQGMAFSKEELSQYEFKKVKDKQILVGPAMIPNKKIVRYDEEGSPYFVFFSTETISMMVDKFNRDNNNRSINIDHSAEMAPGFIQQNWIVADPFYDKSRSYGYNLPVGTWFIEIKITDEQFWNTQIKEEGRYSFSIEGLLGQKISKYHKEEDEIDRVLKNLTPKDIQEILFSLKKKISFDFDGTLDRPDIQAIAKKKLESTNNEVYIITRRDEIKASSEVYKVAKALGIKKENIYFTNGKWKYPTIQLLDIDIHYDDTPSEIALIRASIPTECILV